ncbi:Bromodomain-containing protein 7 [Sciurus carolinensis]|uniref:Bromodomain-containing protein 7 n=1 Tax=Sciurus carolinensis TaxID=30640 RepID=A0AA41SSL4_SCICA|nr:Bromodomain-containing protein 7 [Sciurus carolinensis]
MGKKHKKHKSDKHLYEEYVGKTLKLALKVGGNEVTELPTGSSGTTAASSKTKTIMTNTRTESGKRGRKERSRFQGKKREENGEESRRIRRNEFETMWRTRQKKTSRVIPLTMKEKIKNNDYQSIEELKDNSKLMCTNAMIYNKPEIIYYKAAKKLLHSGMKILSQERIQSLKQNIDFMADLQKTRKQKDRTDALQSGEDGGCWSQDREDSGDAETQTFKSPNKDNKKKDKDVEKKQLRKGTGAD